MMARLRLLQGDQKCDTKALSLEAMRRGTRLVRSKVVVVRTVRPKDCAQLLLRVGLTPRL
jgi:hypothetical protein